MKKSLLVWGVLLSTAYSGTLIWVAYPKLGGLRGMDLNSLGDFLAGAFSPLAFLWLVLGFIQQGRELKISSEALLLQADELRNSVEQQAEMTRIQSVTLANQDRLMQPIFNIRHVERYHLEGDFYERFEISNSGGYCDGITVTVIQDGESLHPIDIEPMNTGVARTFSVDDLPRRAELHVSCRALNGTRATRIYDLYEWYGENEDRGYSARQRQHDGDAVSK